MVTFDHGKGDIPQVIPIITENIRTGKDNYTWGRPASDSRILKLLNISPQKLGVSEEEPIAELWLASDDQTYSSVAKLADDSTIKLSALLQEQGENILGYEHFRRYGPSMATIMKCIDAGQSLSVQVHPAMGHLTRPAKPEMWMPRYEGASLYLGFNQNINSEQLQQAYAQGTLENLLYPLQAKPEDLIIVGGGLIHAIRQGTTLWEWSHAPTGEEIKKGDLKHATVSPWDRTDGKKQRPNKEDIDSTLEVLDDATNRAGLPVYKEIDLANIFSSRKTLLTMGDNEITRLFTTPEVIVDEIRVGSVLKQETNNHGYPLFVMEGSVEILSGTQPYVYVLPSAACVIMSASAGRYMLINKDTHNPSRVIRWYAPLDSDLKPN
ncbi:MAG: hypothetical protein Q8Q31_00265 [Nanoarchaeota archaeon]|nr:hypothetical protein [Nanoarchaeota archaeon]